ncbi:hypothetical protein HGRIS_012564 [Hohenbuehelia grisea]|uniref:Uncharacterized protein n=1 Tax=Hohenbuehelia grisea TaxID=104357 RepID=A0ABR3ISM5_9AGAR
MVRLSAYFLLSLISCICAVVVEHDGGTPGFTSAIARMPYDNIGIAVLSNDGNVGGSFTQVIKYRIFDEALGLTPFDFDSLLKPLAAETQGAGPALSRPANATPPTGGFEAIAGKYNDGGYGPVELCLASAVNGSSPSGGSKSCQSLLTNASVILPGVINPAVPTYLVRVDKVFAEFLSLAHYDGDIFNVSALTSYPTGNASAPFWVDGATPGVAGVVATFSSDGNGTGFGITGGAWGAVADDPIGNMVKERSEVWFSKV